MLRSLLAGLFEVSGAPWGPFGALWASRAFLCASWGHVREPGGHLGVPPCRLLFGPFRSLLDDVFGSLRCLWGHLRALWGRLEALLDCLGPFRGVSGAFSGLSSVRQSGNGQIIQKQFDNQKFCSVGPRERLWAVRDLRQAIFSMLEFFRGAGAFLKPFRKAFWASSKPPRVDVGLRERRRYDGQRLHFF